MPYKAAVSQHLSFQPEATGREARCKHALRRNGCGGRAVEFGTPSALCIREGVQAASALAFELGLDALDPLAEACLLGKFGGYLLARMDHRSVVATAEGLADFHQGIVSHGAA